MLPPKPQALASPSRRQFLRGATAAAVGGSIAATLTSARQVHAAGDGTLKVALIGCGGRGRGAAANAIGADPNVKLTALADLFPDALALAQRSLQAELKDKYAVTPEQCFTGFDAYKKVMETDVDVVLLCSPPHFRPAHLEAAVAAGKHIFCEKPVAVDAPGVRRVMAVTAAAAEKKLNLVSGLCWRYDYGVRETMKRIQEGAIGEIVAIQENYLTGELWHRGRKPEWSEMEYQCRNWLYFTWLSGDHIVEQHIHSLDKAMWLMGDQPPLKAFGLGGRQVRTDEKYGHAYDHFAVCYEWANGVKTFAFTRQMENCANDVNDYVVGTKGKAAVLSNTVNGEGGAWKYQGPRPSMYDVEHQELFAALRKGEVINNGDYMCKSTLLAILGREVCYTGRNISWDEMLNSGIDLSPAKYEFGELKTAPLARPGKA